MLIIINLILYYILLLQPPVFPCEEGKNIRQLNGKDELEILERETKVSLQDIQETFPDYPIRIFSLTD